MDFPYYQTHDAAIRLSVMHFVLLLICGFLSVASYGAYYSIQPQQKATIVAAMYPSNASLVYQRNNTLDNTSHVYQLDGTLSDDATARRLEMVFQVCNGVAFAASLLCMVAAAVSILTFTFMPTMPGDPCDEENQQKFLNTHGPRGEILTARGRKHITSCYYLVLVLFACACWATSAAGIVMGLRLVGLHSGTGFVVFLFAYSALTMTFLWLFLRVRLPAMFGKGEYIYSWDAFKAELYHEGGRERKALAGPGSAEVTPFSSACQDTIGEALPASAGSAPSTPEDTRSPNTAPEDTSGEVEASPTLNSACLIS